MHEMILNTKPPFHLFSPKIFKCVYFINWLIFFFNFKENPRNEVLADNIYRTEQKMERQQEVFILFFIEMLILKVILKENEWLLDEISYFIDMQINWLVLK